MTEDTLLLAAERVVLADQIAAATLAISDGRIRAVTPGIDPAAERLPPTQVLLPGLVDTHVHVNEPGRTEWEGFASATRAAAAGGVTTLLDMPLNSVPVTTSVAALEAKIASTAGKLSTDVGFWGGAVPENLGSLRALWEAGVFGFKCFTLPSGIDEFAPLDADQLEAAMAEIAAFDGLLIVHAEDAATIEAAAREPGLDHRAFEASRPPEAERRAIARVVDGVRATGCRTHVLHLADAGSLPLLAAAKAEGLPLTVETCPHYLTLTSEQVAPGATASKCCPPIRGAANREALWAGLAAGTIDLVVSDHSPCTAALKRFAPEQVPGAWGSQGVGGDFGTAWGGVASVQLGLSLLWTDARRRGFDLADVCRWTATAPADLAGLTDRGRIAVGARADLVAFSPDEAWVVLPEKLHHRNAVTAHAERTVAGVVERVWRAGSEQTAPALVPRPGTTLPGAPA